MTVLDRSPARARAQPLDPMTPVPYRVRANVAETADTRTLTLEPVAEAVRPADSGQFNMLWAPGLGEVPISVSHSHEELLVHTVRDVGTVTHALCGKQPGDQVGVRGPFGVGWPSTAARGRDLILVTGGIGLAPLRPVIRDVLTHPHKFGRVTLVLGARSAHDICFIEELNGWQDDERLQVHSTVDQPCSHWQGSVGVVTRELRKLSVEDPNTMAMICGPEVMMRFVAADLEGRGVRPENIHVSMERNMQCGIGLCGHCQLSDVFMCVDGPVLPWPKAQALMAVRHL